MSDYSENNSDIEERLEKKGKISESLSDGEIVEDDGDRKKHKHRSKEHRKRRKHRKRRRETSESSSSS